MAEIGNEATPQTGGGNKILLIIGGLLVIGIIGAAAVGLFLAFTLGWIGGGTDIIVGFPDSDYNYDLFMVEMGTSEDDGVELVEEADIGSYSVYVYQDNEITKVIQGAGFVPDSSYLFLAYQDDEDAVFEQMQTNGDSPSDLFSTEDYPVLVAFPEQKRVIIVEYLDDETRCYTAPFGEEADRVAKGSDCMILPDGETIMLVEEDDDEYTFTAIDLNTGDENKLLALDGMLDLYMISPDGSLLAYVEEKDDEKELHLLNINEEEDDTIADGFGIPDFGFAPESNDFYYIVEDDEGNLALYINDDNDAVAEGMLMAAQFDPAGEYLIYSAGDESDDMVISSYSVEGEDSVDIADGEGLEFAVISSPAQVLVTETNDNGDVTFFACSLDGEEVNELFDLDAVYYYEIWYALDHDYVYYLVYNEDGVSAYASPSGEEGYFFMEEWSDIYLLNVSPNGAYLAFSAVEDDGDDPILYFLDLADGDEPVELDDDGEWFNNAVFTNNNRELLYTVETGSDYDEVNVNLVVLADADPETLYDEAYLFDVEWDLLEPFNYASFAYLMEGESYCPGAATLSGGNPLDTSIDEDETVCFRFSVGAGEVWHIDIDTEDAAQDLEATIVDRDGNYVTYNDDGIFDYDPWVAYHFEESGVYYVEISDLSGVAGDFTIELFEGEDSMENAEEIGLEESAYGTITFDPPMFLTSPEFDEGAIGGIAGTVYKIDLEADVPAAFYIYNNEGAEIYLGILDEDHYWMYEDDSYLDYGESMLLFTPYDSGTYYLLAYYFQEEEPETLSLDFELYTTSEEVAAGSFGEIYFDQTVFGNLAYGVVDQWEFYGYSGDTVLISMESSDFDTYLYLIDPYGYEVASNDDGGDNRNSLIEYTLESTGYFTIEAGSYGSSGSGEYALSLEQIVPTVEEPVDDYTFAGSIDFGESVTSYLFDGANDGWEFYGEAGTSISISLASEDFDCVLELLDSNGVEVAYNDDSGGDRDSFIESYVLESTGYFMIIARSYGNAGGGNYQLSLWTEDSYIEEDAVGQEGTVDIGDSFTTDLSTGVEDYWYLDASAGDVISILMVSEDFDTYLELLDEDGYLLTYDDDSGGDRDSYIWAYTIPEDGTFIITARSYGNNYGGSYTLSIEAASFTPEDDLSYGNSVGDTLDSGERLIWSFDGTEGDIVTISLESEDFDTYLELRDADGVTLIVDDDGGDEGGNSLISNFELPESGTFLIVVRGYSGSADGDFTLSLELEN